VITGTAEPELQWRTRGKPPTREEYVPHVTIVYVTNCVVLAISSQDKQTMLSRCFHQNHGRAHYDDRITLQYSFLLTRTGIREVYLSFQMKAHVKNHLDQEVYRRVSPDHRMCLWPAVNWYIDRARYWYYHGTLPRHQDIVVGFIGQEYEISQVMYDINIIHLFVLSN